MEGQKDANHIRFKLVPLIHAGISTNRANVDHSIAEFNESTTLLGQLDAREVSEREVDEFLVLVLSNPLNEAVASKVLAQTDRSQSVFSEAEVKERGDLRGGSAELLLLLGQIRPADLFRMRLSFFGRGEVEPTNPMAHLWRSCERSWSISGDTPCKCRRVKVSAQTWSMVTILNPNRKIEIKNSGIQLTLLAGVRVPSTSKRQIVSLTGRSSRAGYKLAASVDMVTAAIADVG